jgi:glycolate oxidase FAD binding subunit
MARRAERAAAFGVTSVASLESTEAVAARVREARATRTTLRLVGRGHWLDAGRPVEASERLELRALSGITSYEPGDLTLTARAGTSLAEIGEATAREGQWLTLDPFGSRDGSIGATIATASSGSLASAFGTPRDHLLGCELVTGLGDVVHAGGRVVKNVAGFDLARLMTGAWGTLGALTAVTVRLRARPELDVTLAIELDATRVDACTDAWRWLRTSVFTPLAAELCSPALARQLGLGDRSTLLVRLGGNETLVRAARQSTTELGSTREVVPDVWDRLRESEPAGAVVIRLGTLPANIGVLWSSASDAVRRAGGFAHATLARGVVRCVVPASATEEENGRLRGMIDALQSTGSRVIERLPRALWNDAPLAAADPLSRQVKAAFDPDGLLNPGILGSYA